MAHLLVIGASGLLGSAICARARAQDHRVLAMVRGRSSRLVSLQSIGCELVEGDLKDSRCLDELCRKVNAVVTTANSMMSRQRGDSLESVDRLGSLDLVRTAARSGVERFIYTSVSPTLPENNALVRYKREVEQAVRSSGMTWTILQPTAFMEVHTGAVAGWDFVRGVARVVGTGQTPIGYISVDDVAAFAVSSLTHPTARNRALPLRGPQPLSALEAVAIAERVTGLTFRVRRAPLPLLKLVRTAAGPFRSHFDALLGLMIGQEASAADLPPSPYEAFGVAPTTFEQYVRRCVA